MTAQATRASVELADVVRGRKLTSIYQKIVRIRHSSHAEIEEWIKAGSRAENRGRALLKYGPRNYARPVSAFGSPFTHVPNPKRTLSLQHWTKQERRTIYNWLCANNSPSVGDMELAKKASAELHSQGALVSSRNELAVQRQIRTIRSLETAQEVEQWINSGI